MCTVVTLNDTGRDSLQQYNGLSLGLNTRNESVVETPGQGGESQSNTYWQIDACDLFGESVFAREMLVRLQNAGYDNGVISFPEIGSEFAHGKLNKPQTVGAGFTI